MYSRLYWFLYRRRQKILLTIFIGFIVFVFFSKGQSKSRSNSSAVDKPKSQVRRNQVRINRETYQIPEPCVNCPGENGAAVFLTVSRSMKGTSKHSICLELLGRRN